MAAVSYIFPFVGLKQASLGKILGIKLGPTCSGVLKSKVTFRMAEHQVLASITGEESLWGVENLDLLQNPGGTPAALLFLQQQNFGLGLTHISLLVFLNLPSLRQEWIMFSWHLYSVQMDSLISELWTPPTVSVLLPHFLGPGIINARSDNWHFHFPALLLSPLFLFLKLCGKWKRVLTGVGG